MIFLDANAFYWYLGREKIFKQTSTPKLDVEKLRFYLDGIIEKSIPASVFMEMLVHFRDNPDAMVRIIKFREQKNIQIFNNHPQCCFTPDELTVLHTITNPHFLKDYASKLLDAKISIEVNHSCVFL